MERHYNAKGSPLVPPNHQHFPTQSSSPMMHFNQLNTSWKIPLQTFTNSHFYFLTIPESATSQVLLQQPKRRRWPGISQWNKFNNVCYRMSREQGRSAAGSIRSMRNSSDTIGDQNRNFPTRSAVHTSGTPFMKSGISAFLTLRLRCFGLLDCNLVRDNLLPQFPGYLLPWAYLLTYSMEQSPSWEANWFCS